MQMTGPDDTSLEDAVEEDNLPQTLVPPPSTRANQSTLGTGLLSSTRPLLVLVLVLVLVLLFALSVYRPRTVLLNAPSDCVAKGKRKRIRAR